MIAAETRLVPALSWRRDHKGASIAAVLHGGVALALLAAPTVPPTQPPTPLVMVEFVRVAPPSPPIPQPVPAAAPPAAKPTVKPPLKPGTKAAPPPLPSPARPTAETFPDHAAENAADTPSAATTSSEPPAAATSASTTTAAAAEDFVPARSDVASLNNPKPPYPPLARRRGLEGVVILAVAVDELGRAQDVNVRQSSGHALLDQSAMETVRSWRFVPARRGGHTVAAEVQVPIRFALTGAS